MECLPNKTKSWGKKTKNRSLLLFKNGFESLDEQQKKANILNKKYILII